MGDVFLAAGDAVERLVAQHVEPPSRSCIVKQPDHPGPAAHGSTGDGLIIADLSDMPTFVRRISSADTELIVDGLRAMEIG